MVKKKEDSKKKEEDEIQTESIFIPVKQESVSPTQLVDRKTPASEVGKV